VYYVLSAMVLVLIVMVLASCAKKQAKAFTICPGAPKVLIPDGCYADGAEIRCGDRHYVYTCNAPRTSK
jgi:hypothetical protein